MNRSQFYGHAAGMVVASALVWPTLVLAQSTALSANQRQAIDQVRTSRDLTYVGPLIVNGAPQGPAGYRPQVQNGIPTNLALQPQPPIQRTPTPPVSSRGFEVKFITPTADAFDHADADHDGRLSRSEFLSTVRGKAPATFEGADVNEDGFLTREEFMAPYSVLITVAR